MALIKCPDCGKEMSDTAQKCINCGRTLKNQSTIGVFIISLLVPFLGIIIYLIGKATSNEEVSKAGIKGFFANIVICIAIVIIGVLVSLGNSNKEIIERYNTEISDLYKETVNYSCKYIAETNGERNLPFPIETKDTYTLEKCMPSLRDKYKQYLGHISINENGELVLTGVIHNLYGTKT
jgi:uncharacterized membrane protein YiaA